MPLPGHIDTVEILTDEVDDIAVPSRRQSQPALLAGNPHHGGEAIEQRDVKRQGENGQYEQFERPPHWG